MKRAIYLGAAAVAAYQLFQAVRAYAQAAKPKRPVPKEDIHRWEGEGGNPAPQRPRASA